MSKNPKFAYPEAAKIDTLNHVRQFLAETFGDSLYIIKDGISRNGNVYITLVLVTNMSLDKWYSQRKGELPLDLGDLPIIHNDGTKYEKIQQKTNSKKKSSKKKS